MTTVDTETDTVRTTDTDRPTATDRTTTTDRATSTTTDSYYYNMFRCALPTLYNVHVCITKCLRFVLESLPVSL